MPLRASQETAILPSALIEACELVYRTADASLAPFDISEGDLLIVEPKKHAETGELVLAHIDARFYVGRWWAKHGRRDVVGADGHSIIVREPTLVGSINLIVRPQ